MTRNICRRTLYSVYVELYIAASHQGAVTFFRLHFWFKLIQWGPASSAWCLNLIGFLCVPPVHTATLFLNVLACLAYFTASSDNGVDFGLSILWFILFTPVSFVCWYRPVYKAFRYIGGGTLSEQRGSTQELLLSSAAFIMNTSVC